MAARATFLAHGATAPVSLIADALGISQAALFHRVQSKDALIRKALRPGVPQAVAFLTTSPTTRPVRAQLAPVLMGLLLYLREIIPSLIVLRSAGVPIEETMPPGEPPTVMLRNLLSAWLTRARVTKPWVSAEALLGALEARAFNGYLGGASFTPQTDEEFVSALLTGLIALKSKP